MIDISKLNKADVLAALYNYSKPQGFGFLHFTSEDMTREEAEELLKAKSGNKEICFNYLKGRVMKIDLSRDKLDPRLYDRDNGKGAAQRAISTLFKQPNNHNNARNILSEMKCMTIDEIAEALHQAGLNASYTSFNSRTFANSIPVPCPYGSETWDTYRKQIAKELSKRLNIYRKR